MVASIQRCKRPLRFVFPHPRRVRKARPAISEASVPAITLGPSSAPGIPWCLRPHVVE
jgi:hypothetical protein